MWGIQVVDVITSVNDTYTFYQYTIISTCIPTILSFTLNSPPVNIELDDASIICGGTCYSCSSKILTRNTLNDEIHILNVHEVISDIHEVFDMNR